VNLAILSFVMGVICVAQLPVLVAPHWLFIGLPSAIFGLSRRFSGPVCGLFMGITFGVLTGYERINELFPSHLKGNDLEISVRINSLVQKEGGNIRFSANVIDGPIEIRRKRVLLSCYRCEGSYAPGEMWRFVVRLNRPVGTLNPPLFDYAGWVMMQQIIATGYISNPAEAVLVRPADYFSLHHQLRSFLHDTILQALDDTPQRALVIALVIGESSAISSAAWGVLSATGTNHLFVISGLHVGLVGAITYRMLSLARLPVLAIALGTILSTGLYSLLAGFGLPVQRAFLMTTIVCLAHLLQRHFSMLSVFLLALAGVVIVEPYSVLGTGFWLSFGAVFCLLYAFTSRFRSQARFFGTWLNELIRTQWVVTVGLMPLMLYLLNQFSWVSLPANLIAIPLVGGVVIPALLVALITIPISQDLFQFCLQLITSLLGVVWWFLTWLAGFDLTFTRPRMALLAVFIAFAGSLFLFAPRGLLPRWMVLFCMLPMLNYSSSKPRLLNVTFIDVGQGLAVLLETPKQVILYDAGPAFAGGFDAGERIVTPFLRSRGITAIDHLIASHPDLDHAGGIDAVASRFLVGRRYASEAGHEVLSCATGFQWREGELKFHLLSTGEQVKSNNKSCILVITGGGFSVLLTGDIEQSAEWRLVGELQGLLEQPVELISVPHHGSNTSSSPALLNALMPNIAVASTALDNRFGHPHGVVVQRYRSRHTRFINTAASGAVVVDFSRLRADVVTAREVWQRFWQPADRLGSRHQNTDQKH
jgi:competence protein ComEC